MSFGAIASACCCSEGCETECCDWWACSPAGPINVVLTGSAVTTRSIAPGSQVFVIEEIHWSITATMTRSGNTCAISAPYTNLHRFTAQTCVFSYQKITRNYDVGKWHVCTNFCDTGCCWKTIFAGCETLEDPGLSGVLLPSSPWFSCNAGDPCLLAYALPRGPDPCLVWNCSGKDCNNGLVGEEGCTDCGCPQTTDDLIFKHVQTTESAFTGNITGSGSSCGASSDCAPFACPIGSPAVNPMNLVRAGDVLTIVCVPEHCKSGCVRPVLLFTPTFTGQQISITIDHTMDECCSPPCEPADCLTESLEALCVKPFFILGKGNCLNASTFDDPLTGCSALPAPSSTFLSEGLDMAGIGCLECQPLNQSLVVGENCIETAFKGSPYFCATETQACCLPLLDPNCTPTFYSSKVCYWPAWCENDERTTTWTWTM